MKTLFCLLLLTFAACSPVRVASTSATPGVDLAAYRTYNFLDVTARNETDFPGPGGSIPELKDAIAGQLEQRGFRRAARPDLWVNLGVVVKNQVQTRQTDIREAPRYIGQRNYHWQSQEVVVDQYEEGTTTVELIDAARNERVWTGTTVGTLTKNPDKLKKRLDEAMRVLFEKFPVGSQQK